MGIKLIDMINSFSSVETILFLLFLSLIFIVIFFCLFLIFSFHRKIALDSNYFFHEFLLLVSLETITITVMIRVAFEIIQKIVFWIVEQR